MHDPCGVSGFQRLAELPGDCDAPIDGQSPFPFQLLVQVLALDVSHRDKLDAFDVAQIMDPQDVFVGNLARQQQLLFEALHRLRVGHQIGTHQLQRYRAIEIVVVGFVDGTHASLAELRFDAVARTELGARFQREWIARSG